MSDWVDIVDEEDNIIGRALRRDCHGDPSLMHRVAHILVFNEAGEILLQLRGENKRIQPDKWDTSVGGHLMPGESYEKGAARELLEELGISSRAIKHMHDYIWRSDIETERVRTFFLVHNGPFKYQESEIQEIRFWTLGEVESDLCKGTFTPNFEEEWKRYLLWSSHQNS